MHFNVVRIRRAISRQGLAAGLLSIMLCMFGSSAYAHKVNIFAYLESDRIYVQGYFLDGKKARGGKVTVYSDSGSLLSEGVTNEEGEFAFPMPVKQGIRIVLNAGEGHQTEYSFLADELTEGANNRAPTQGNVTGVAPASANVAVGNSLGAPPADASLRRAVAEGILPLAKEVAELKERRAVSDIIGGLGFIVGVIGLFAYFKVSRKRL